MKKIMVIISCLILVLTLASCRGAEQAQAQVEVEKMTGNTITLDELMGKLGQVKVVDTRASYRYNGWSEANKTGGHIPSAVNFSAEWLDLFESDDMMLLELKRLNVAAEDQVVLYGPDSDKVYEHLMGIGFDKLSILKEDFEDYAKDKEISKLKNYDKLVHPDFINDLLNNKPVKDYTNDHFMIFEASWGKGESYELGHIPGAVHINTDEFEEEPIWNRKSDEAIKAAILANGITQDTTVVLYGPDATPAARIAIILKYAGVKDVRLLDGGYRAWEKSGYAIEVGKVEKTSVAVFGADIPQNSDLIIDMPAAKAVLKSGNLVSIRSYEEFIGQTSGYSYIEPKGRIAGSLYGQDTSAYRNIDGTMFNYELMAKDWADRGIVDSKANAFYCGTGWRAAETLYYADLMGWQNASLYDGGWYEWSSLEENPVEAGAPK